MSKAVAEELHKGKGSFAAPAGYALLRVFVAATGCNGGHIYSASKRGSLCGIEKRLQYNEREVDFEGEDFAGWLKENEPFVCRLCLRIYRHND